MVSQSLGSRELVDPATRVFDDSIQLGGYVLSHSVQDHCEKVVAILLVFSVPQSLLLSFQAFFLGGSGGIPPDYIFK